VSAILLLAEGMIIISYIQVTHNNYFAISKHLVTIRNASVDLLRPRNQEHISHRSSVMANFLLKFSNFRYHGKTGGSGVSVNDTFRFAAIENSLHGARIRNIPPIEVHL